MNNFFICRHGQASFDADSDALRSLTEKGKQDTYSVGAQFIAPFLSVDTRLGSRLSSENKDNQPLKVVACVSPYLRTQQSFESLIKGLHDSSVNFEITKVDVDELTPNTSVDSAIDTLQSLSQSYPSDVYLVVTHMPLISSLLSNLIEGDSASSHQYPMMPASCIYLQADVVAKACGEMRQEFHPY